MRIRHALGQDQRETARQILTQINPADLFHDVSSNLKRRAQYSLSSKYIL
jgi:hypothetical protein